MGEFDRLLDQQPLTLALLAAGQKIGRPTVDFAVSVPTTSQFGDLTSDFALRLAAVEKEEPRALADKIAQKLQLPASVSEATVAGPGFLNFKLTDKGWEEIFEAWLEADLFKNKSYAGQTVVVEFSSPNIGKPFLVGNLRSTILGDVTARLYEQAGAKVIRVNHLGDWGTQFGKLIAAVQHWGDLKKIAKNPTTELLALYVKFHDEAEKDPKLEEEGRAWFAKLEEGDEEATDLWQKIVDWSLADYTKLYDQLGVKFDHLGDRGESFYNRGMMDDVLDELKSKKLLQESDGAQVLIFPQEELPSTILVKKDGTTVYLLRDLAALKYRLTDWRADKIIYHIGAEQTLHFRQLFRAAVLLGWVEESEVDQKLVAAYHGLYRLATGKMSTRQGTSILLDELLQQGQAAATKLLKEKSPDLPKEERERQAAEIALGAIKYNDLAQNRTSAITFDWERALNLNGNSAPYLMYALARAHGLFRQAKLKPAELEVEVESAAARLTDPKERQLILSALKLRAAAARATDSASPHYLADELFVLARLFNSYYGEVPIITEDKALTNARLALVKAVAQTLKSGLTLLGIAAPTKI